MPYLCFSGDVARLGPTATGPCGALTPGEESSEELGPRGRQMCLLEVASARASPVKLGSTNEHYTSVTLEGLPATDISKYMKLTSVIQPNQQISMKLAIVGQQ